MEYVNLGLLLFQTRSQNDAFLFPKKKKCILIARQNKIRTLISPERHVSPSCLYFFSVSQKKRNLMSLLVFSAQIFLGKGLMPHSVTLSKSPTEVQVTTLFAAVIHSKNMQ